MKARPAVNTARNREQAARREAGAVQQQPHARDQLAIDAAGERRRENGAGDEGRSQRHEEPLRDGAPQAQPLGARLLLHEPQRGAASDDRGADPDAEPMRRERRDRFDADGDERRDAHRDAAFAGNRREGVRRLDRAADVTQILDGSRVDRSRF